MSRLAASLAFESYVTVFDGSHVSCYVDGADELACQRFVQGLVKQAEVLELAGPLTSVSGELPGPEAEPAPLYRRGEQTHQFCLILQVCSPISPFTEPAFCRL